MSSTVLSLCSHLFQFHYEEVLDVYLEEMEELYINVHLGSYKLGPLTFGTCWKDKVGAYQWPEIPLLP